MATKQERETFINTIGPLIVEEAKRRGYHVASPIIAQACVESAYGKSGLSAKYHNYFGLKCGSAWKGKSVNMKTKEEYKQGQLTTIKDNFRVFDSMTDGVKGYFDFISTKRYSNLKTARDPKSYLEMIKSDGYATSFKYVATNLDCITLNNLKRFDNFSSTEGKKTNEEIALEVIDSKWGNGEDRKNRLTAAGYDYATVQKIVNQLLKEGVR